MGHNPLVTIIIPVYNAGEYLLLAVESVINQTFKNLQIIVVNDGSTDNCIDTIKDIVDQRLTILHQPNSGKSIAMNNALKIAKGKYYAIQDADDLSAPERVEVLVDEMERYPNLGAVFSGFDLIIKDKIKFAPNYVKKDELECKKDINQYRMPSHDPTGFYRLSMVKEFNYDPELRIGQGYDYILRIGEKYPIKVVGRCLYSYRIGKGSTTRKTNERRQKMVYRVWEKACQRNKIDFEYWKTTNKTSLKSLKCDDNQYGIVPHCMESIITLKVDRKFSEALTVAFICCKLHPFDYNYYKPLIYSITPLKLISYYRALKKQTIL